MSELVIVAHITAQPDSIDLVKAELEKLIPTRAEEGCLQYDLHQDNEDAAHFVFFERWASKPLWDAHMESAHIAALLAATEGALADLAVHQMTHTG